MGKGCPGTRDAQASYCPMASEKGALPSLTSLPSLPRIERSTDQVIKPVNLEALSKWTGHIPRDVVRDMAQIAPMLARLGYDPYANPPNYGNPDPIVINNTHRVSGCTQECENRLWLSGGSSLWDPEPYVFCLTEIMDRCRFSTLIWAKRELKAHRCPLSLFLSKQIHLCRGSHFTAFPVSLATHVHV